VSLFEGYFFVQHEMEGLPVSKINTMPGVIRILSVDGRLQTIFDSIIKVIQERCKASSAQEGRVTPTFKPGDKALVKNGPFHGLEVLFLGPTTPTFRVKVLLHLLGRPNEVMMDVDALEEVTNYQLPSYRGTSHRGTRGHGRAISRQEAASEQRQVSLRAHGER